MSTFSATYFDGKSAAAHNVSLAITGTGLQIAADGDGVADQEWAFDQLVANEPLRKNRSTVLRCREQGDAVLQVDDAAFIPALLAAAPQLSRAHLKDNASLYRPGWWAIALPMLVLVLLIALGPELLVRILPAQTKSQLGRMAVSSLVNGAPVCGGQAGMTALSNLAMRLQGPADGDTMFTISVIDDSSINAFAAPGGHVIMTAGLIDALQTPGELGFVLAHEMSHLDHEDALHAMVREHGVTATLRALAGGSHAVTALAGGLLSKAHSRRVEDRADRDAVRRLYEAGIDPGEIRGLFARLTRDDMDHNALEFIRTHPVSTNRQNLLQSMLKKQKDRHDGEAGQLAPALDGEMWQAVQNVCGNRS